VVRDADVRVQVTTRGRQLRRIWRRAGLACTALLIAALALPRVQRALDPQSERRAMAQRLERTQRETAPVFVMPNGERRRVVAVTRADPTPVPDGRSDRALRWWCGILALVTVAGAAAQSARVYFTEDEEEES
jgi:hypothetical protein